MAFKDWEKIRETRDDIEFHHRETPEVLAIFYWRARKLWYVESNKIESGVIKETKSKQQALRSAKQYMRTH